VADTFYNTAGQVKTSYGGYPNSGSPGTTLLTPVDPAVVDTQTATVYDGTGRVTASIFQPGGHEAWRTTTAYGGDRVDVTPPAGGTATSTVTDARDRTVELRQYHGPSPAGAFDSTTYSFNRKGLLSTVTDPAGNQWSYVYDLRGRQISATDPDSGTATSVYDDGNELASSTDSRGQTLAYDYDVLGRKVGVRDGSASGPLRASWVYDTLARGHLTSSTRFVSGNAYTTTVHGYTTRYDPTGLDVTVPAVEGALAGTYSTQYGYFPDGTPAGTIFPAAGGLSSEAVGHAYDPVLGLPTATSTRSGTYRTSYVTRTDYSPLGQVIQYIMQLTGGVSTAQVYGYQPGTNRLQQSAVGTSGQPTISQVTYSYDQAGNITSAADAPPSLTADTQCYSYDYLRRLTQAWTPGSNDCTVAPTAAGLGGAAPYWQQWSYDATGNRLTQTDHATANGDVSTTSSYPAAGAAQPHTLLSSTTTDNTGTLARSYGYDTAGNTRSRPGVAGQQTLVWDAEGHLTSASDTTGTSSFIYDADGNRLIRHDPGGATLYLPNTELRLSAPSGAVSATRYYTHAGRLVAMRTAAGVTWLMSDQQGTSTIAISASSPTTAQVRRETPFGGARGTVPSWPNEKGFVGGTADPTGLTHLGAREYDPSVGRFVAADVVVDHGDPQQQNGYAYANNSPVSMSDASGKRTCDSDTCGGEQLPSHAPAAGNAPSGQGPAGKPPAEQAPKKNDQGSGSFWDQAWKKAKSGFHTAVNFAETHKAEIAGAVVGIAVGAAVGAACLAATMGAGSVGCAMLAGAAGGAAGSMVTYALATPEKERSLGGLLVAGVVGAVVGAATVGIGAKVAPFVGAPARAVAGKIASAVLRTAEQKAVGSAVRTAAESCAVNSFSAGTLVLMADGTRKPIEQLKAGDRVMAEDPQAGVEKGEAIERVIVGQGPKHLYDVRVAGGTIEATYNHPFWVVEEQAFEWAQDLRPGEHLVLADGRAASVTAVTHHDQITTVYNLSITEIHTFFVGSSPVLVHNSCVPDGGGNVSQLLGQMRGVARLKAGFGAEGEPLIVDNSIGVNPQTVASTLRGAGYNARSVGEIFGRDPGDASIKGLADVANGRVIASDVGHDIGGGFGDRWIPIPGQIRTVDSILRLVGAA
jgi:RHS repeat-associated protein